MKRSLYGKYPGKLKYDANYIKNCSEMELFIQISGYYEKEKKLEYLDYCQKMIDFYQKTSDEKLTNYFKQLKEKTEQECNSYLKNIEENNYALDFCILESARFGTNVTYNPNGRVNRTSKFEEWYKNWQLYSLTMDDNTLAVYRRYRYEASSLESFTLNQPLDTIRDDEDKISEINKVKKYSYKELTKNIKQNLA